MYIKKLACWVLQQQAIATSYVGHAVNWKKLSWLDNFVVVVIVQYICMHARMQRWYLLVCTDCEKWGTRTPNLLSITIEYLNLLELALSLSLKGVHLDLNTWIVLCGLGNSSPLTSHLSIYLYNHNMNSSSLTLCNNAVLPNGLGAGIGLAVQRGWWIDC